MWEFVLFLLNILSNFPQVVFELGFVDLRERAALSTRGRSQNLLALMLSKKDVIYVLVLKVETGPHQKVYHPRIRFVYVGGDSIRKNQALLLLQKRESQLHIEWQE